MKFRNLFMMLTLSLFTMTVTAQTNTYQTSAITGSTIGYATLDTIPTDSIESATTGVLGSYRTTTEFETLMAENNSLREQNLDLISQLGSSADSLVGCQTQLDIVLDQQTVLIETTNQIADQLSVQAPRSRTFGLGVGYYTQEQLDVTAQLYLGESLITGSYVFDDNTDLSFRVGVGQQMNNRFTLVATSTFNRFNDEWLDNAYGIDVQYRIYEDFNISVGVDSQKEIRLGALYNL